MRTTLALIIGLAALVLVAAAPGNPSAVQVSGPSPFQRCTEDEAARQPGFFTPSTEVEPRLGVNPKNPRNLVGTYQQDRWNNGAARGVVAAASFDGGLTWTTSPIPGLSRCSGGSYDRATDPWLSFAPNGDVYHVALVLDGRITRRPHLREPGIGRERQPPEGGGGYRASALLVSKSTSGGLTWGTPAAVNQDDGDGFNDKESILADPVDPNRAYLAWDYYHGRGAQATSEVLFSRTGDGGRTWERPRPIYSPDFDHAAGYPQLVAQPDGTLLAFFAYWIYHRDAQGEIDAYQNFVALKRSHDRGATWEPRGEPLTAARTSARSIRVGGAYLRTGAYIPDVANDRRTGLVYLTWQDDRFWPGPGAAFSMSADNGNTWSAPLRASQTPVPNPYVAEVAQAFTPTVAVGRDGTVAVSYYDLRNHRPGGGTILTDHWVSLCRPVYPTDCANPANWREERRLTDDSFDMLQAPYAYGYFVGDYQGLGSDGIDFLAFFSRVHPGDRASVFFRRIPF